MASRMLGSQRTRFVRAWVRLLCAVVVALGGLLLGRSEAHAELTVSSLEHGPWPATVAALQTDLRSEGATLHVVVADESGRRAACGAYVLGFDAVGEAAFALGACDPTTFATQVVLRRRSALFAHGDLVARPLAVSITAIETRSTRVSGAATEHGGSEVACAVAVHPYLRDMETGAIVRLPPGRFVLRPLVAGVTAAVEADGWNLLGATAGLVIDYEVVDTQRGEVVLHDRATLQCGATSLSAAARVATACPEAVPLVAGVMVQGSTLGAPSQLQPRCGGSSANPERVYALTLEVRSRVSLRLTSSFDGVLAVRDGCNTAAPELACNDDAGDTRHSAVDLTLDAGVHYVFVDGWGSAGVGAFSLVATVTPATGDAGDFPAPPPVVAVPPAPPPPPPPTCDDATTLPLDGSTHGTTAGQPARVRASCGANATGPERVYTLTLPRRSHVRLRLTSTFDGVLYVRRACGGEELACNDDAGDTRHSALDLTLDAGAWYVFVDGYGDNASGTFELSVQTSATRPKIGLRAGVTYNGSGSFLGFAPGFTVAASARFPLGNVGIDIGARFGMETYSGAPDARRAPFDLTVMTVGLPIVTDVPMLDGLLHIYTLLEPALLISRATDASGNAERSLGGAFVVGLGTEVRVTRWLGLYAELDYRFASMTAFGNEGALASSQGVVAGLHVEL